MAEVLTDTGVQPLILELLSRRNWFDAQRLEEIEQTLQKAKPGTLSEVALIRGGFISEQEVASVYAEDLFLPVVNSTVEACPVDKELGGLLPEKLCVDRLICPLAVRDTVLDVAFVSPEEMGVVDELQLMTGSADQSDDRAVVGGGIAAGRALSLDSRHQGHRRGDRRFRRARGRSRQRQREHPRPGYRAAGRCQRADRADGQPDSSSRRFATVPATSTSSRSRTAASSGCASTACCTSCRRRRRASSS